MIKNQIKYHKIYVSVVIEVSPVETNNINIKKGLKK
jgi:hypothetical protein